MALGKVLLCWPGVGLVLAPPTPLKEKAADVQQEMLGIVLFLQGCHFAAEFKEEQQEEEALGRLRRA